MQYPTYLFKWENDPTWGLQHLSKTSTYSQLYYEAMQDIAFPFTYLNGRMIWLEDFHALLKQFTNSVSKGLEKLE